MLAKFQENIAEFFMVKEYNNTCWQNCFFLSGYELNEVSSYTHYLI